MTGNADDTISPPLTLMSQGELAADYIEQLLDILDFDGDIDIEVDGVRPHVSVTGGGDELENLIGYQGKTLEALQELTRLSIQRQAGEHSLLLLDIADYRKKRRTKLQNLTYDAAQEVTTTRSKFSFEPMSSYDRKVIHDTVANIEGVYSESSGEKTLRHVVLFPDDE